MKTAKWTGIPQVVLGHIKVLSHDNLFVPTVTTLQVPVKFVSTTAAKDWSQTVKVAVVEADIPLDEKVLLPAQLESDLQKNEQVKQDPSLLYQLKAHIASWVASHPQVG